MISRGSGWNSEAGCSDIRQFTLLAVSVNSTVNLMVVSFEADFEVAAPETALAAIAPKKLAMTRATGGCAPMPSRRGN